MLQNFGGGSEYQVPQIFREDLRVKMICRDTRERVVLLGRTYRARRVQISKRDLHVLLSLKE